MAATPRVLGPAGGIVVVIGHPRGATECALEASAAHLAIVYSHAARRCGDGVFRARVRVGPNHGRVGVPVHLRLGSFRDGGSAWAGTVVTVRARQLGPSTGVTPGPSVTGLTTTSPPAAAATTTVPALGTVPPGTVPTGTVPTGTVPTGTVPTGTVPTGTAPTGTAPTGTGAAGGGTVTTTTAARASVTASNVSSQNWSGYSVTGGAFGAAQGTFTVPELSPSTTCSQDTSEWVGVDGFSVSGSDTDLIQAGVDESPIDPYSGACTPGTFYVVPWWEILPAAETPISTMTVNAGDVVSVQLSQLSSSQWSIVVADETDGQSFSTQQAYSGPATSAEWIVEAPMDSTNCGGICGLAPYCVPSGQNCTSPVTFSGAQADGPQSQWWAISMDQGAGVVSAPSNLAGGTFTVSYSPSTAGAFVPSGSAVLVHPASALRVVAPSVSGGPHRPGASGTSPLGRGWSVYQG